MSIKLLESIKLLQIVKCCFVFLLIKMSDNNDFKVKKLRGKLNYKNWQFAATNFLALKGLKDCIIETDEGEAKEKDAVKLGTAHTTLNLLVDECLYKHILHSKSALETWKIFQRKYNDDSIFCKSDLIGRLSNIRLKNHSSMDSYINEFIETAQDLSAVGFEVSEQWLGYLMLTHLTPEYRTFTLSYETAGLPITGESVAAKLLTSSVGMASTSKAFKAHNNNGKKHYNKQKQQNPSSDGKSRGNGPSSSNGNFRTPSGKNSKKQNNSNHSAHSTCEGAFSATLIESSSSSDTQEISSQNIDSDFNLEFTGFETLDDSDVSVSADFDEELFEKLEFDENEFLQLEDDSSENGANIAIVTQSANHAKNEVESDWLIDSGASSHMSGNQILFKQYSPASGSVQVADGKVLNITKKADLKMNFDSGAVTVKNVVCVSGLHANLLSVYQIVSAGNKVVFDKSGCRIYNQQRQVVASCQPRNGVYSLSAQMSHANVATSDGCDALTWHKRLGHLNSQTLKKMANQVAGLQVKTANYDDIKNCVACATGKQTRDPFPPSTSRSSAILDLIHSDLCGAMRTQTLGGSLYFMTFIDDYSRKVFTYFLRSKDQVASTFIDYITLIENQTDRRIKVLRTDNGTEYVNKRMTDFLREKGIAHQLTCPYSPQQNGIAERMNRTLIEKAKCMIKQAGMPNTFWGESIKMAEFIVNHTPCSSINGIPDELFYDKKIDISNLKTFGCRVYYLIDKSKRSKWDDNSSEGFFVGLDDNSKGYRVYDRKLRKIAVKHDVKFHENVSYGDTLKSNKNRRCDDNDPDPSSSDEDNDDDDVGFNIPLASDDSETESDPDDDPNGDQSNQNNGNQSNQNDEENQNDNQADQGNQNNDGPDNQADHENQNDGGQDNDDEQNSGEEEDAGEPAGDNKTKERKIRKPFKGRLEVKSNADANKQSSTRSGVGFGNPFSNLFGSGSANIAIVCDPEFVFNCDQIRPLDDPVTLKDVQSRPDRLKWVEAMKDEMLSLKENNTWTLVQLPHGKKVVRSKWIFKTKYNSDGELEKYKARLVARGFTQRYGIDYDETFSPVVRYGSVRLLLAIAAQNRLQIEQMDVHTAYLNADIPKNVEIFLSQPEGFDDGTGRVCKLKKSLYGLKQAGRLWNHTIDSVLKQFGLKRSLMDPCIYYANDLKLLVSIYVDDILIFFSSKAKAIELKTTLSNHFKMSDLGPVKSIIGLRITQTDDSIEIDQSVYIAEVLKRFGMENCKPAKTPAETGKKLKIPEEHEIVDVPYQQAVGALLYISQGTRPDICHAVNVASRFNQKHGDAHWTAVKRIMRYLQATQHYKLRFSQSRTINLTGYSDSDYAGDDDDRKSTSGFIFLLSGNVISWYSGKQKTVTLSSTEAEFVALTLTIQEAIHLQQILSEIEHSPPSTKLFVDNVSTISIAKNNNFSFRTKHLDVRQKFIAEQCPQKNIDILHVSTNDNIADFLTKALSAEKHQKFSLMSGIKAN